MSARFFAVSSDMFLLIVVKSKYAFNSNYFDEGILKLAMLCNLVWRQWSALMLMIVRERVWACCTMSYRDMLNDCMIPLSRTASTMSSACQLRMMIIRASRFLQLPAAIPYHPPGDFML